MLILDYVQSSTSEEVKKAVSVTEVPLQFIPLCISVLSAKIKSYARWKHHTPSDAVYNGELLL